uniref:Alpha-dioxygenase 2-like n=1 Tax=Rhizophora mucronata TaxID=61149 RepID=A0A2P2LZ47_RHIMU
MIPISKWGDLTDDEEVTAALQEVYGDDVEKLDLLVGLHAEKKIKGFAISETAFFIFLLMATRYIFSSSYIKELLNVKFLRILQYFHLLNQHFFSELGTYNLNKRVKSRRVVTHGC